MTKIFLIRHAEAEGNVYRRAHGQFNGQIIGKAKSQIKQLRERFEAEKIDAVYSSDLSRTIDTAKAISDPRGLQITTTERLREVMVGEWEDIAWGDIIHNYKEMSDNFGHDPARWKIEGSEDYYHVRSRLKDCLCELGRSHEGQSIAAVSHGFAIRAILCELMSIPSEKTDLIPYCDNTAVALLCYNNGELSIEYHGDNSHLHSENSTLGNQTWWREERERISEDLRYMPFDDKRDAGLLSICGDGMGSDKCGDVKITSFLENESKGLLWLDTTREAEKGIGWVSLLAMKPELRLIEFEVQLLGQAVSEYRKLRRERLRLEAAKGSSLMMLCEKYGFRQTGETASMFLMEKEIRIWGRS